MSGKKILANIQGPCTCQKGQLNEVGKSEVRMMICEYSIKFFLERKKTRKGKVTIVKI